MMLKAKDRDSELTWQIEGIAEKSPCREARVSS